MTEHQLDFPLVAIDTETGGAGPTQCRSHALLSVGAYTRIVDRTGQLRVLDFHAYILPEAPLRVEDEAARVNGYTLARWHACGAVNEHTAMMRFINWLAGVLAAADAPRLTAVAHNAGHDQGFLEAALIRTGMLGTVREMMIRRWECSCAALGFHRRKYHIPGGCSLDDLTALRLNQPVEIVKQRRGIHEADDDARECWMGYRWLCGMPAQMWESQEESLAHSQGGTE